MRRKFIMGTLALALPIGVVAALATPGYAASKPPPFSGAATGSVSCALPKLQVSFSPPLTTAYTGPATVTVKGSLLDCTTHGSNVTIKKGKVLGTFTSSGGCIGLASGTESPVKLTIEWKGKTTANGKATIANSTVTVNGAGPAFKGQDVGFELPNPNDPGGSVGGSFAGSVMNESYAYSTTTISQSGADCTPTSKTTAKGTKTKPAKGLKKLKVTSGTITLP